MTVVAVNDDVITCTWFEVDGEGGWGKCGRGAFPSAALSKAPERGQQAEAVN